MGNDKDKRLRDTTGTDVHGFLRKLAATPRLKPAGRGGRLLFAMDATASRGPTWDRACHIQGQMFTNTEALGGLDLQLCYYRGFGEFHSSSWVRDSASLLPLMTAVRCLGGQTQIEKVLRHALSESRSTRLDALVFVGDCVEEDVDRLCALAGELGLRRVPVFVFHEGNEPFAAGALKQIAQLSGGACCPFDSASAAQLGELLGAVAVFAAGGRKALADFGKRSSEAVRLLSRQLD